MFNPLLRNLTIPLPLRTLRQYTQAVPAVDPSQPRTVQYPYFVPRNTRGNLPVYTDVRNGGTRYLVTIRNVDGNANLLAKDLSMSLFQQNSSEATRLKIEIVRSKNLIISGGHWKNDIMEWLQKKGF
ncbi:mitochondrial large subunit ribosomal protein-domain-containing protein [Collybia nuda]|uniref:Large ribosomal subunit protein mL49 n=1 Tax=Collybia nuda TaxID=64659 RepID=A0A9P6CDZ2_9AGAR|nr:mitochondrial large subunit ribosomal protein-domain-containing protein [Collybia nuda]